MLGQAAELPPFSQASYADGPPAMRQTGRRVCLSPKRKAGAPTRSLLHVDLVDPVVLILDRAGLDAGERLAELLHDGADVLHAVDDALVAVVDLADRGR